MKFLWGVAAMAVIATTAFANQKPQMATEPLIAAITYVELDEKGTESNRVALQSPLPTSGPCIVSIACASGYRARVRVSEIDEKQLGIEFGHRPTASQYFRAEIRIVKVNADKSETVLVPNGKLTFPRESRGNFMGRDLPIQIGVKVAEAKAHGDLVSDAAPVADTPAKLEIKRPTPGSAVPKGFSAPGRRVPGE